MAYIKSKHASDMSINLKRVIVALESEPNAPELLKKIAPLINWGEESTRHVNIEGFGRSSEYKDSTKDSLFASLKEETLISLISESMFEAKFSNTDPVPYRYCFENSRFELLKEYISQFSGFITNNLKEAPNRYIYLLSHRGENSALNTALETIGTSFSINRHDGKKPFDFTSLLEINTWFTNVLASLEQVSSYEPSLMSKALKEAAAKGKSSQLDLASLTSQSDLGYGASFLKEYQDTAATLKQKILDCWLMCAFISSPGVKDEEYVKTFSLISSHALNKKDCSLNNAITTLLLEEPAKKGYHSYNTHNSEVQDKFLDYMVYKMSPLRFEALVKEIILLPKPKAQEAIDLMTEVFLSTICVNAKDFICSSHTIYSQREIYEESSKDEMRHFSNMKESFLKFKETIEKNNFALTVSPKIHEYIDTAIFETLASQCPLVLEYIHKVFPEHKLTINDKIYSLEETAFLYHRALEIFNKAEFKSNIKIIDYRDKKSIKEHLKKDHDLKGAKDYGDNYFRLNEFYNVRREQHISFGANKALLPTLDLLPIMSKNVSKTQRDKINSTLFASPNVITTLPGLMSLKIKPIGPIEWERFVLNEKVSPPPKAIDGAENSPKKLKI